MITSYTFGKMVIGGQEYKKDLVILPDGSIHLPWWRKSGHRLALADIGIVLDARPTVLVVGMGAFGLMVPEADLEDKLGARGIKVIFKPTKQAVAEYNSLSSGGESVAACFHLTC